MLVDFHTHVFPDKIASKTIDVLKANSNGTAYADGTVLGLKKAMEKAKCDIAVALPVLTKPTQFDGVLDFTYNLNQEFILTKRGILSFAGIHPSCEDIASKMKKVKEMGFLGVKIHPDFQQTFIDDDGYVEILKCAKDLDLIVVTHAGVDDGYIGQPVKCTPDRVIKLLGKVNYNKFVLAHFGGHKLWEEVLDKLCGFDIYFDTAFTFHEINENLFKKIVDKHGEDKILFATDSPWRDILDDVNILKSYNLSNEVFDKICYKNALKLLKIGE